MHTYQIISSLLITVSLTTGCKSPSMPSFMQRSGPSDSAEEWIDANVNQDLNRALKYTCFAERENLQDANFWLTAFAALASGLFGISSEMDGDISDLTFELLNQKDGEAIVKVAGELRVTSFGTADAFQIDEFWHMVYENDTWRWCGNAINPSIPPETEFTNSKDAENAGVFGGIPFVYVPDDDFWIMKTEVTNSTWKRFMDAGGYTQNAYWSSEGWQWRVENGVVEPAKASDHIDLSRPYQPVVGVSWYEAEAFGNWLSEETGRPMSLPSDAEWYRACAGTDNREFPWGDEPRPNPNLLNFSLSHIWETVEVGSYPDGASPYGALDMVGNAKEWTKDFTLRGGSWEGDTLGRYDRVVCNDKEAANPGIRYKLNGFRLISPGK